MVIISNGYAIHDVSNFASSCRVADPCEMFHGQSVGSTHYLVHTSLAFGHYYLGIVECDCVWQYRYNKEGVLIELAI